MEFSIVYSDLKEQEIKPTKLIDEYKQLIEADNKEFFPINKLENSNCPACNSSHKTKLFTKCGLDYVHCDNCQTVFIDPKPNQSEISEYFKSSKARKFWHEEIWNSTKSTRQTKVLDRLAQWMESFLLESFSSKELKIAELNPCNIGLFEAASSSKILNNVTLIEPMYDSSLYTEAKANVKNKNEAGNYEAICLFDALSRFAKPAEELQWVSQHLKPNGLCFITTIFSTGFDILELGEKSPAFLPPDRLSLFSFEGFQQLINLDEFELIEMSTPGVLDVENVLNGSKELESPFLQYLLRSRADTNATKNFQNFLQTNGLSSQGRIVLRKK